MANTIGALTTISTAILALFAALGASACDDPEDPGSLASLAATDDEHGPGLGDALDRADALEPQETPPPKGFSIKSVTAIGKGCPEPGSVSVLMSADKTAMRIIYHDMVLKKSPGPAIQTTNCQTALTLAIPAGWQVAPASLTTRGFAHLDKGIKALRNTSIFFAGLPVPLKFETDLEGPINKLLMAMDKVPPDSPVWSKCGTSSILSINNSLVLNAAANPEGVSFFKLHDQRLVSWHFKKC